MRLILNSRSQFCTTATLFCGGVRVRMTMKRWPSRGRRSGVSAARGSRVKIGAARQRPASRGGRWPPQRRPFHEIELGAARMPGRGSPRRAPTPAGAPECRRAGARRFLFAGLVRHVGQELPPAPRLLVELRLHQHPGFRRAGIDHQMLGSLPACENRNTRCGSSVAVLGLGALDEARARLRRGDGIESQLLSRRCGCHRVQAGHVRVRRG